MGYTITPEYETKSSVKRMDNEYTKDHEQTKDKNHFDVTSTPVYEHQKAHIKATGKLPYKQDFEKNKGKMLGTDVTPEMARAHEMEPIRNNQKYQEQAKKDLVKTHVGPDGQEIAHAVVMAHQASPIVYKDDYNKNVLGQGPANPAIAFPENDRLKKIHDQTSRPNYQKEARKELQKNMLPVDTPEFIRAKETAKNASDLEYTKQRAQTVADYRGFQTMDAREHPEVTRGMKAKQLTDDKAYKQDWEDDKSMVYFPYTITPEYDTKYGLKKHDNEYTMDHDKTKDKNRFDVVDTPVYNQIKEVQAQTNDLNYKQDFEKNKGKMLGTDITPEMARAHEMEPIRNKQKYQEQAKKDLVKTHVGPDGQEIAHAVVMSHKASPIVYKDDYNKNV